jgi:hypothetical protein
MTEKTRFQIPARPVHPWGWACENCFHSLKDTASPQMICTHNPPTPQLSAIGAGQGIVAIQAPVSVGQWCGQYITREKFVPNSDQMRPPY